MFNFKEKAAGYLYITQQDYGLICYIGILQFYDSYYYLITSSWRLALFCEHLAPEKPRIHSPLGFVNWTKKSLWIDTCENKISVYPEHSAAGHFQRKVKAGPCRALLAESRRPCWNVSAASQRNQQALGLALSLQRYLYSLIVYCKRIQLISVALHLGWPAQIRLQHWS